MQGWLLAQLCLQQLLQQHMLHEAVGGARAMDSSGISCYGVMRQQAALLYLQQRAQNNLQPSVSYVVEVLQHSVSASTQAHRVHTAQASTATN